jgi:glycyl-tRNA synthetase
MCDSYEVQQLEKDTRVVMHLHPAVAPYKAAILPLSKQLSEQALELEHKLAKEFSVVFDETGSIGKRYRRQDAIGTPFCITYDFDSVNDGCVTIRERDSMEQVRLPMDQVISYLREKTSF